MSNVIYLDNAATTRVHQSVIERMLPYFSHVFGNPSSLHKPGRDARKATEDAREQIAGFINCAPHELYFTSGGTEADNLALFGIATAAEAKGRHIITTPIEHHAILNTCQRLQKEGFEVSYAPVDEHGVVDIRALEELIRPDTILISVMFANNEVGTLQDIRAIGEIARSRGIPFHTDAIQALGKIKIDVQELNVDLMSLSAHKIHGPKGIGALYVRKGTRIAKRQFGGHHERNLRAGTENVPGIVGFAEAMSFVHRNFEQNVQHMRLLRDKLEAGIKKRISDVKVNGHPERRVPNILNVSFYYIASEAVILHMDRKGICVSSGSACTSEILDVSHVLTAMGVPHQIAHGSIRFSFSFENTEEEVAHTLDALDEIVRKLREMSPLYVRTG